MLVASDKLATNGGFGAVNKVKGDLFMVAGATLYGFSEFIVRRCLRRPPYFFVISERC